MKFFNIYPDKFFTVFTSPNRHIYVDALFVLRNLYQNSPVVPKENLVSAFIANLEDKMLELEAEDEVLGLDDNLSSRAHFLIRKFLETGWLEREQDPKSFTEQFIVPVYASKLLNLFYDIIQGKSTEYNGFVYSTYSILKTADEERGEYMYDGLKQAHQLTENLQNALRELLANLRFYHQRLQEQYEIKDILAEHFDVFRSKISDKIYHPLKTFDSVPRFKIRIIKVIKKWLSEPQLLDSMAQTAQKRGFDPSFEVCRQRVILMLGDILDTYQNIDKMLNTIDKKNSAYTRASVERMQYFLNTDRNIRGKLVEVLKELPKLSDKEDTELVSKLCEGLPLFSQSYLDENSLYVQPKRKREHSPSPTNLKSEINEDDVVQEMAEFKERLKQVYSHQKVLDYILAQLQKQGTLRTQDLQLETDDDFIKIILACIKVDEKDLPYTIDFTDDYLVVNGYRLPEMVIARRKDVS